MYCGVNTHISSKVTKVERCKTKYQYPKAFFSFETIRQCYFMVVYSLYTQCFNVIPKIPQCWSLLLEENKCNLRATMMLSAFLSAGVFQVGEENALGRPG